MMFLKETPGNCPMLPSFQRCRACHEVLQSKSSWFAERRQVDVKASSDFSNVTALHQLAIFNYRR
jgi:hypothetical protein